MELQQFARRDGQFVRRYNYDDSGVVAVDLNDPAAAVDVVDGTVIVVFGDGEQVELELPAGRDAQAFINNGILTIELNDQ